MNFFTVLLVYTIAWWLTLFCLLPVGVVSQAEAKEQGLGDDMVEGSAPSAPVAPNLKKKFLWTSCIAAVLTFAYWLIITFELITIEPMA